jgi:hypothetical protein
LAKSKNRFAQLFMERLRRRGWRDAIAYDEARFALHLGGSRFFLLANSYRDWEEARRWDKDRQLDMAVASIFESDFGESFDEVETHLLPVIRSRVQFENHRLMLSPDAPTDSSATGDFRPFCGALAEAVAVDRPNSVHIVNNRQLALWQKSLEKLLTLAIANLGARSPFRFERMSGGFYQAAYGDHYDASRLLLPHLFRALPLSGKPVAVPVSRSKLVVAGTEDRAALEAMADFVDKEIEQETRSLAYLPLILEDEGWVPCAPGQIPVPAIDRLRLRQQLWDAAEQKSLLEKHFEEIGRDVFVATLKGLEEDGRAYSWTTWTAEADSLLPQADAIALVRLGGRESMIRHWSDVARICGPLPLEAGWYPSRYHVERGPSEEEWQKLASCPEPDWFKRG